MQATIFKENNTSWQAWTRPHVWKGRCLSRRHIDETWGDGWENNVLGGTRKSVHPGGSSPLELVVSRQCFSVGSKPLEFGGLHVELWPFLFPREFRPLLFYRKETFQNMMWYPKVFLRDVHHGSVRLYVLRKLVGAIYRSLVRICIEPFPYLRGIPSLEIENVSWF